MKNVFEKLGFAGVASIAAAAITFVLHLALGSMYFTPFVVCLMIAGIALCLISSASGIELLTIPSYACSFVAMYRFLVLEVDYRMDKIVDTGIGDLDTMFFLIVAGFVLTAVFSIWNSAA